MNIATAMKVRRMTPDLIFKELYHEKLHGIIDNNINIIDPRLDCVIEKINNEDSILHKVNNFILLLKMWASDYECNYGVLQYIFSNISLDTFRGIHIYNITH